MATTGGILFPTIKLEETGTLMMMIIPIMLVMCIPLIGVMEGNVFLCFVTTTSRNNKEKNE